MPETPRKNTHKIGLMGGGVVADYGHIPAIKQADGLTLHALFDPDPKRLKWMLERHDIAHGYTDVEEFFASGIDAVSVTSPAPFHHANVLGAAAHKLPVICEKPLAMNDAQAHSMIAAMKQAGVPLYSALCYRFAGPALKIKQLIDDGTLGEIRAMRLVYNWDCHGKWEPDPDKPGQWRVAPRRHGRMVEGGPMVDCGVHQIDLARWWLGEDVENWRADAAWIDDDYEAPDHVWLHLHTAGGVHSVVEMSYGYGHQVKDGIAHFRYEVIGTQGVVVYDREAGRFDLHTGAATEHFGYMTEKDFGGMYREFEQALRTGEPGKMCTAEDGLIAADLARKATDRLIAERAGQARSVSVAEA